MAFFHDSTRLAMASRDKTVKIWDANSGEVLLALEGHVNGSTSVAFSHDSTLLATGSFDYKVKVWDVSSGKCLQTLETDEVVRSVAFPQDSTQLAAGSYGGKIFIWNTTSGELIQTLGGHTGRIASVAFSQDSGLSTRLASASYDRTIKIWVVSRGECVQTFNTGRVLFNVSFDSTGSYLRPDIGLIVLNVAPASDTAISMDAEKALYRGAALSPDGVWITYNTENLLWLPSEYRPSCSALSGDIIGIGCRSGKILICDINSAKLGV